MLHEIPYQGKGEGFSQALCRQDSPRRRVWRRRILILRGPERFWSGSGRREDGAISGAMARSRTRARRLDYGQAPMQAAAVRQTDSQG